MPLLLDRLSHLADTSTDLVPVWKAAISKPGELAQVQAYESAKLNAMYHIASPGVGEIRVGSRGAVYALPEQFDFEKWFGSSEEMLFHEYVQVAKGADKDLLQSYKVNSNWYLVGIRTACDDAQSQKGTNRLVLALEVELPAPQSIGPQKENGPIVRSPEYERDEKTRLLVINWLYMLGITEQDFTENKLVALFRLRDSMCTYLEHRFSAHASRPGIIDLKKL